MHFHIITNVWGERHVDLFLGLTLPNVLSAGNLPAMARLGEVTYRFFTTRAARNRIESSPLIEAIRGFAQVDFVTSLEDSNPDVAYHVHWFHRAAAEAKRAHAIAVFVPPDTLWTDGSFKRFGELISEGYSGVACPFLLVVADTCVPEAQERFMARRTAVMAIPPSSIWDLAQRHLHPLQLLSMPGVRHARPAFEMHWPVGSEGIVSRYAVRELVAFDPRRCPITFLWYPGNLPEGQDIYFGADSDEMLMLSVDPLEKYFANYILDHTCDPCDLARTTRHPLNDTRHTRTFVQRPVRIHGEAQTPASWRRRELLSEGAARDILVGQRAMQLWRAMRKYGCTKASELLSVALLATPMSRQWREREPLAVIVPTDRAMAGFRETALRTLQAPGQEQSLMKFVRDHVVRAPFRAGQTCKTLSGSELRLEAVHGSLTINGHPVTAGPEEIEGTTLYVIDGITTQAPIELSQD